MSSKIKVGVKSNSAPLSTQTRDNLADHRAFLLRMGVSTKVVNQRIERIRKKRDRKMLPDKPRW
jgi:hypothetical protein